MGRQRLRRFLFLDGDLTNDFLSQLEGGTYEQESLTQAGGQRSARGGALGFGPVRADVTRDGSHETVSARTMQQTRSRPPLTQRSTRRRRSPSRGSARCWAC